MTAVVVQSFTELALSPYTTEFLSDVLVLQRYVELEGKLEKVLAVVKMRTSPHDTSIHRYSIEPSGVVIGGPVQGHDGVLTGLPHVRTQSTLRPPAALAASGRRPTNAKPRPKAEKSGGGRGNAKRRR